MRPWLYLLGGLTLAILSAGLLLVLTQRAAHFWRSVL